LSIFSDSFLSLNPIPFPQIFFKVQTYIIVVPPFNPSTLPNVQSTSISTVLLPAEITDSGKIEMEMRRENEKGIKANWHKAMANIFGVFFFCC
jgi:hypothetical protein